MNYKCGASPAGRTLHRVSGASCFAPRRGYTTPMHPLLHALGARGGRRAIRHAGGVATYAQLEALALAHVARMRSEGVGPGDRVAIWATAELPTIAAIVGHALLGAATVPLNPAIGAGELAHVLRDAAPRAVLAASPDGFRARTPDVAGIDLSGPARPGVAGDPDPDDPFVVLYTSGTTGPPKGAVITHRNAAFDLDALAAAWGWSEADALVHALPLFHVHGLILGVFGTLRVGAALQLLPRFAPEAVCAAMQGGGTMLFGVPTMYHRLAEHGEHHPEDARRLGRARLLVSGSAALPVRDNDRVANVFGQRPVERYGLTETLIVCAARHDGPRTPGLVGPPLPGLALRLVDDERRTMEAGADVLGEVAVKGPTVFPGYLNRPDATRAAMDDHGFFYTGDIAAVTEGGDLRIVGRRATDLIKTGGYKVGAGEVEAALLEHAAVREAAVIGVPDEDLGERIVAFVVPAADVAVRPGELADHVAARLAPHKRPRTVHLVRELPRNAMGKVLKKQLPALLT